ncbi:MAG: alpha/beta hydrolase [Comamonadaceae bacterium]|nr:MAG: alpha/beta hydrolase [Comamonadaceae bacterium]
MRISDLRGIAVLATQATSGAARIAEGVHQSVWSTLGVPGGARPGTTRGITGFVYRSVQGVTQLVGKAVDGALAQLQPLFELAGQEPPGTPAREAVLAALNGVMGDRLAAGNNPLATPMRLRHDGAATGKLLVLAHGLCMNDLQWGRQHADALAALGYTPVWLRYNSGLHISQNGQELSRQLEQLLGGWPVPVQELAIVAHSMGGLVARSACEDAQRNGRRWIGQLAHLVFLGTPHHGAPLERAGNWVDVLLGATPYTRPFSRLVQLRSAGITDLRYGHMLETEWAGHDRFRRTPDRREVLPLPAGVACYTVAATTAGKRSAVADRLLGDGLVPLRSALGQHDDPARCLDFPRDAQWIGYRTGHMALLHHPDVTRQLVRWLSAPAAA